MRVTVFANPRTGTTHGTMYFLRSVVRRAECGYQRRTGDYYPFREEPIIGHYTDWRDRVTCKRCLRVLARIEGVKSDV